MDNQKGQERVLELAKLEMSLGFRSAFNFVPERYTNHEKIKEFLRENGFEIGVHGLKHDGKLFKNWQNFDQRAQKINRYLQEWGSTGFTSPSMHHNLDWLHALNITHSISTFDTDPFEPQPDPVGTIFPFVVYKNSGQRSAMSSHTAPFSLLSHPGSKPPGLPASQLTNFFIELPYTMPQDHLLYIILREKCIDIWKRKLDWIAEKGGMALLNTHTDYMNFNGGNNTLEEYSVELYIDFLNYVKQKYQESYWTVPANEIARFMRNLTNGISSSSVY